MQGNNTRLAFRFPQEICHSPSDKSIANAMKPVLPQLIFLGNLLINWICANMLWDGLMELTVKVGDVFRAGELLDA